MPVPTLSIVTEYLGDAISATPDTVAAALASEQAAQANRCRVPADDAEWPADLAEALCRRVAVNLANRALPLGIQVTLSELNASTAAVGGYDREVKRLEGPYRRWVVG